MPGDFTTELSSQGITLSWGDTEFGVTSMRWSGSAASEIDITSMGSETVADEDYSTHVLVKKAIDFAVIDLGELSCEFFGPGGFTTDQIGSQKTLTVNGTNLSAPAFLTGMSQEIVAGELVKGSCTFKLSNE